MGRVAMFYARKQDCLNRADRESKIFVEVRRECKNLCRMLQVIHALCLYEANVEKKQSAHRA
jgi:hypothetical protein